MPLKQSIIDHILTTYQPAVILLGGSRARNTPRAGSDWDIYLVGDYAVENEQISLDFMGEFLDIALFPVRSLPDKVLRLYFGPVSHLRVLHDNAEKLGEDIVESTRIAYNKGPAPLSEVAKQEKENHTRRILSKIEAYKNTPEQSFFHLANFYQTIIPLWFEIHSEWSVPVQYGMPVIQTRDPEFYDLICTIIQTTDTETHIATCRKIIDHLFLT